MLIALYLFFLAFAEIRFVFLLVVCEISTFLPPVVFFLKLPFSS